MCRWVGILILEGASLENTGWGRMAHKQSTDTSGQRDSKKKMHAKLLHTLSALHKWTKKHTRAAHVNVWKYGYSKAHNLQKKREGIFAHIFCAAQMGVSLAKQTEHQTRAAHVGVWEYWYFRAPNSKKKERRTPCHNLRYQVYAHMHAEQTIVGSKLQNFCNFCMHYITCTHIHTLIHKIWYIILCTTRTKR